MVYENCKHRLLTCAIVSKTNLFFQCWEDSKQGYIIVYMAVDQPKYTVLKKDGDIELREYEGYILASVNIRADGHNSAGNQGFGPLAGYIFGDNKPRQKMAMTVPVITAEEPESTKLAMTAPVMSQDLGESTYKVSFVMPPGYKMDDLPVPNNSDVKLKDIPRHKSLAIRFSGYSNEHKVEDKLQKLKAWAKENDISLAGSPMLARYDAPWKPGFLRHNEIIINCK